MGNTGSAAGNGGNPVRPALAVERRMQQITNRPLLSRFDKAIDGTRHKGWQEGLSQSSPAPRPQVSQVTQWSDGHAVAREDARKASWRNCSQASSIRASSCLPALLIPPAYLARVLARHSVAVAPLGHLRDVRPRRRAALAEPFLPALAARAVPCLAKVAQKGSICALFACPAPRWVAQGCRRCPPHCRRCPRRCPREWRLLLRGRWGRRGRRGWRPFL